ncbi:MAG: DUF1223 domain-containing protein [Ginsengibacter sp.]
MKKLVYIMSVSILVFTLWFCTSSTTMKNKPESNKIAILELFTSQGCSSCPPADKLVATYTSKENVIPLSFHVDYWDRLGWKDPFSSHGYSQRQYMYASALHSNVYTPQLIVNGTIEMVGSDANKISTALNKIFSEHADASLTIGKTQIQNGKININFDVSGNIQNSVLNIALIEKKTVTPVKAGENGGATLTDYNVVRSFKTVSKVESGENNTSIDFPTTLEFSNRSVVLYLQQKKDNHISAASKSDF